MRFRRIPAERLSRPLIVPSVLLIRNYRRYFRCALEVPIHLAGVDRELKAKTTNISMGGLAIRTLQEIRLAERFRLEFVLPNAVALKVDGEVVWADTQGRAGMRFPQLPVLAHRRLQTWLDSRM